MSKQRPLLAKLIPSLQALNSSLYCKASQTITSAGTMALKMRRDRSVPIHPYGAGGQLADCRHRSPKAGLVSFDILDDANGSLNCMGPALVV